MKKIIIVVSCLMFLIISLIIIITNSKENEKKSIFSDIKIYEKENEERYKNFSLKHKNMSKEKIVLYVNMGLDNSFYTDIKTIKYVKFNTLVNKYYKLNEQYYLKEAYLLSKEYTYKDVYVSKKIVKDLEKMINDMKKENLEITVVSGYRTKEYQENLYNRYKEKDGKKKADTYSARPRHSEHELGLSIDVSSKGGIMEQFAFSKEFLWMQENAYKYGFILRYPEGKTHITGFKYESWHYRYVGKKHAKKIKKENLTFDEYYELYLKRSLFSNEE